MDAPPGLTVSALAQCVAMHAQCTHVGKLAIPPVGRSEQTGTCSLQCAAGCRLRQRYSEAAHYEGPRDQATCEQFQGKRQRQRGGPLRPRLKVEGDDERVHPTAGYQAQPRQVHESTASARLQLVHRDTGGLYCAEAERADGSLFQTGAGQALSASPH
ncbi:hypothetical protein NDU88_006671 [Pleurodeles waltl]|uniref:Uncharacterized protein n=1 Tax=Pleurodeles waltl TaxID=8319 RepID=A0AAV7U048_PLEWA|nr:hypothetical protein NDU88_006671 [Pleurodeles waltl]